jgi:signal transduction histidine kinase
MHVLLIDNKKSHGQKIMKLLENAIAGCLVTTRYSALEALAELRNSDYDSLVIGHDLPEADALEMVALVNDTGKNPPIIIISPENGNLISKDGDAPDSNIYYISNSAISDILPLTLVEANRQYSLSRENRQLKSELKLAQANKKIAEIALNCNHRINNPLMTILGNTQLLLRDSFKGDDKIIARLEKIERAAKRIQEITMNLANSLEVQAEPKEMVKSPK